MAKYYAVRKGITPGVYATWPECQAMVKGFSGAEYKSFPTLGEAQAYIDGAGNDNAQSQGPDNAPSLEYPYAFTDGSYDKNTGTVGWGGFLRLSPDAEDQVITGSTTEPAWASMRNVAGEVLGCMAAVKMALGLGLKTLHVYHDYTGVSCWPDGAWAANKPETKAYAQFINKARAGGLDIIFHKVAGHTGVPGNEKADQLAKAAAFGRAVTEDA